MADPRDQVELSGSGEGNTGFAGLSGRSAGPGQPTEARGDGPARPWLALFFRCSNSYTRAYRNAEGTGYTGRCPKCGKSIRFMVGPGGTPQRMFEVSC